jgi:VIT1/CCC1 family predicted Fe2+/Mn2+ transporter
MPHPHKHYSHRAPWLRAAVLGAMDGLGSIAALLLGVQGGAASRRAILLAGASGAVAGALSMGASEYVSVASQRDAQRADVAAEAAALREAPADELDELRRIYVARGLDEDTAERVAAQLSARDALTAHARDEVRCFQGTA